MTIKYPELRNYMVLKHTRELLTEYNRAVEETKAAERRLREWHETFTIPMHEYTLQAISVGTGKLLETNYILPDEIIYPNFGHVITDKMLHGSVIDDKLSDIAATVSSNITRFTDSVQDAWHDNLDVFRNGGASVGQYLTASVKAVGLVSVFTVSKLRDKSNDKEKAKNVHKLQVALRYALAAVNSLKETFNRNYEESVIHSNGMRDLVTRFVDTDPHPDIPLSIDQKKMLLTLCNGARLLKHCIERQITY